MKEPDLIISTHMTPRAQPLGQLREHSTNAYQNMSSETRTAHPDERKHSSQTHQQTLGRDATK